MVSSVRHVALVSWKPTATAEQIRTAQQAFPGFVPHMKGLIGFHVSPAIENAPDGYADWHFGYISDFTSIENFKAYQADPMHTEYGIKYVHAARQDSRRVQYLCEGSTHKGAGNMVRHLTLFQWHEGASTTGISAAQAAFADAARQAPGSLGFSAGPNLKIDMRPDLNWDYATVADFRDLEAYHAYRRSAAFAEADRRIAAIRQASHGVVCNWPA
jgi:hypothetical protein